MTRAEILASMDPRRWPWPYAPADVAAYEARIDRIRLGAPCPDWMPSAEDIADERRDAERLIEEQEVAWALARLPDLAVPDSPTLGASERIVLGAILERLRGRVALITATEIAKRLYGGSTLTDDRDTVEAAILGLVRRRVIARHAGGGFVVRRQA